MTSNHNKLIKIFKITGWCFLGLILLLVILIFSLRLPAVQRYITSEAVKFFRDKTQTEAAIGRLYVGFPKTVVIEDIYIADLRGDTLLYCNSLRVDTDLWGLLDNRFEINSLEVNKLVANLYNAANDSTFNYQFIVDAFTTSPAVEDTTIQGDPFIFSISEADIQNTRVTYKDLYQGMELDAGIGHFYTSISEFDLNRSSIAIEEIKLEHSEATFSILREAPPTDTATSGSMDITGKSLLLSQVKFTFNDVPGKSRIRTDIGRLQVEMEQMDLNQQRFEMEEITMANSFVSIDQFGNAEDTVTTGAEPAPATPMQMLATTDHAVLQDLSFRFYDHRYPSVGGFDPNHLWVHHLNAKLEDIRFEDGYAQGRIHTLSGMEQGGIALRQLSTTFKFGEKEAYAKDFSMITGNSSIQGNVQVSYPSLEAIGDDPAQLFIEAGFARSTFHLEDLFYFQPALRSDLPYFTDTSGRIIFEGSIRGEMADLRVSDLRVEALQSSHLQLAGSITGLPDVNRTRWDIQIDTLATSAADIMAVLPDTLLPTGIKIPPEITISGTFNGTLADFSSDLSLQSTFGAISADITMREQAPELYGYAGKIMIDAFDVGRLLGQEAQMGKLSLQTEVSGSGFTPDDINTKIKGSISSVVYNGYNYQDLLVNGHLQAKQFKGRLSMDDPNLNFDFNGLVDLNDTIPQYSFTLDLRALNLEALNFANKQVQLQARVTSDITASSAQNINGMLEIEDFTIANASEMYRVDTFILRSVTNRDVTDITVSSPVLDAQFKGTFDLETLPRVLRQHISRYFSLVDTLGIQNLEPQQFSFNINIKRPLFFTEMLVPGLDELQPGPIEGFYNSEEWRLNVDIKVPKLVYDGIGIDSLTIDVHSDEASFGYETRIARLASGNVGVNNVSFSGLVEAGHINTDLIIRDSTGLEKYHLGGILISSPGYYRFQFTPGEFVLNYDPWHIKPSNRIDFYPSGLWIENMLISHNDQQIAIASGITQKGDSILTTRIENFNLSVLGNPDEATLPLITGILNGAFEISMELSAFAFSADLTVDRFGFRGDTLGNIMLDVANGGSNRYSIDLDVKSNVNNLMIDGYYLADSIPAMDVTVDVARLDLSTVESFTMGQLHDLTGWLEGNLKLTGTTTDPDITGGINFHGTTFTVDYLQSRLHINNESIAFGASGITFNEFVILDENENPAQVDGRVLTADYSTFEFDLDVTTDDFLLLNTTEEDNELFYGFLEVNSTARITGTLNQPDIQLSLSIEDEGHLTYVIPEEEIQLQQREGVVEFFDADMKKDPFVEGQEQSGAGDTLAAALTGVNLTAKIDINSNSTLNIIIDPVTGDQLTVQGNANLTLDIKPAGDMTLTGRYEVAEGRYNLNFYGLVKREFDITEGSYIIWTGDPLNARLDITATYTVSAVYEVPGQVEASGQRATFVVYLDIKNELLSPDISFRLGLAESSAAPGAQAFVSNVNKDENEVNAQVFYLLLFKTTKNLESFSTTGGGGNIAEATARSSASRLLSNQLNKLAGNIEGIELNLDVQSYNTTGDEDGGTTQLELGLSKEFFNNRVVVKVAGNFGLEGEEAERQQEFSDFAGDIRIEYKLTEDGRYRLVAFRENEYDNLLQGEIIKTGVGVIFVRDYDAFRELFKKAEEEGE